MTLPTWPEVNFLPERGSWGLALSDGRGRSVTDLDNGGIRIRRRFTRVTSPTSFSVRMTSDELAVFKFFYAEVIKDGTLWFQMPIYDGQGYGVNLVRFDPGSSPTVTELGFNDHEVSLSLTVRELTQISQEAYDYFSKLGATLGARLSGVVYEFVNVVYPKITEGF